MNRPGGSSVQSASSSTTKRRFGEGPGAAEKTRRESSSVYDVFNGRVRNRGIASGPSNGSGSRVKSPRNPPPVMTLARGSERGLTRLDIVLAILPGVLIGFLAGLVGLGGAEERMPFLLYGLGLPMYEMLAANLIVSLMTSGINFALRAQVGLLTPSSLLTAGAMIVGSVPGAYFGAIVSHKVSARRLKAVIAVVLTVVLLKIITDVVFGNQNSSSNLPVEVSLPLAIVLGAGVGVVSGVIGVAGGEYRIPLLIYVFGMSIKLAGTASQLVSLPTVIIALVKHLRFGVPSRRSLALAGIMGVSSVAGVVLSTNVLVNTGENTIRVVFGGILLYTILRILNELRKKGR